MRNVECGKKDKLKQGRPTKEDPRAGLQRPWAEKVLSLVAASPILRGGGLLIFEQGEDEPAFESPGWEMIRERCYGAARLVFYRKQKPETEV
jgi:16S rRNA G966 N2-methylase RsmD